MSMTAVREDVATAGPPRAVPQRRRRRRTYLWSYVYLAPMMVLLLVFVVYPIIASLGYTFYKWDGIGDPSDFVGLGNFRQILHDSIFWRSLGHTFVYAAFVVPVQLVLALALALVLNNKRLRFASFYRTLFFLPVVTSAAVIGVVIQLLVSNFGDGTVAVFDKAKHSAVDYLRRPDGNRVEIDGIWGLTFGNGVALGESNALYFAAGPGPETDGVFGRLTWTEK